MPAASRHVVVSPRVKVGSAVLSGLISRAELVLNAAEVTSFLSGDEWENYHEGGRRTGQVTLEWVGDYSADQVWDALQGLLGTAVAVELQAADGLERWRFDAFVVNVPQVSGARGELATFSTTWMVEEPETVPVPKRLWHTTFVSRDQGAGGTLQRGYNNAAPQLGTIADSSVSGAGLTGTAYIHGLLWSAATGQLRLRMNNNDSVSKLDGLWLRTVDGSDVFVGQVADDGSATHVSWTTANPGWGDGDTIGLEIWDYDPRSA